MDKAYNGKGNHEVKAKGRTKFRVKTFEPFHIEWKEKGKKVWNLVAPNDHNARSWEVVLNNGESINLTTEGKWTISLEPLQTRGETPDGKSVVEILPAGEMNMYDKLRQEMLQMFQNKKMEEGYESMEEANDLDFEEDDENLIDTPYEYREMMEEYWDYMEVKEDQKPKEEEKEVIQENVEEKREEIAT